MRWGLSVVAFALFAIFASDAGANDIQLGATYHGTVQITSSVGGVYLPLPEGDWKVVSLQTTRSTETHTPILNGYLVSLNGMKLKSFISFSISTESAMHGWKVPEYCGRTDIYYFEPKDKRENHEGSEINCWGINHIGMTSGPKAEKYTRDFYEWVPNNTSGMPINTIEVEYNRASGVKFLRARYYFNPEADGFDPPKNAAWRSSDWHRDRLHLDPKKVEYMEHIKAWAISWKNRLESGFRGNPS